MRPYHYDPKTKGYRVDRGANPHGLPGPTRGTRLAAGMTFTYRRHPRNFDGSGLGRGDKPDVLSLVVYGTCAKSLGLMFHASRKACPCCGGKQAGKLALNGHGRARLAVLRRRRENRS